MRDSGGILGQKLRYDGIWWRQLAALGSTYGPEWWKRYSPPLIGAICFGLLKKNRRGAIANMRQIFPEGGPNPTRAALEMFAEFAFCISETLERFGPRPLPVRTGARPGPGRSASGSRTAISWLRPHGDKAASRRSSARAVGVSTYFVAGLRPAFTPDVR